MRNGEIMVNGITHKARWDLGIVIALFLVSVGAAIFTAYEFSQATQWTVHTHLVIEEIQLALSSLQDVETGQRGYLLTHKPEFLEPYNSGRTSTFTHIDEIKKLTADNPVQQQNVVALAALGHKRTAKATEILENAKRSPELVGQFVTLGQGKQLMDEFRLQAAKMIEEEKRLLDRRNAELNQFQNFSFGAIGLIVAVGIGMFIGMARTVQEFITTEQRRAQDLAAEVETRKKTESALKATTVKLANSNNDLQQFAYVASHDLQEPLRAVVGFLTLLERRLKDTLESDTKEWLTHAVDGGQRMRTLVNDLLSYSRVDSQGQALIEDVDLNEAVKGATTNLRASLEETGALITVPDLPKVTGDKTQLTQLFQNLIGNALKYRNPGNKPVIDIGTRREGQKWIFSVKDNGIGFDMEHSKRIFVIFQRLHSRSDHPGTGIGLALCKRIIERHGGDIWCESKINEGSMFFFTIPGKEE